MRRLVSPRFLFPSFTLLRSAHADPSFTFLPCPQHLHRTLLKADPSLSLADRRNLILNLVKVDNHASDADVATWVESSAEAIATEVARIRTDYVSSQIVAFAEKDRGGALEGLTAVLQTLSEEDRKTLIASLAPQ